MTNYHPYQYAIDAGARDAKREELAQAEEHLAETWREFDLVNCRLSMAMARVDDARAALGMARRESDR